VWYIGKENEARKKKAVMSDSEHGVFYCLTHHYLASILTAGQHNVLAFVYLFGFLLCITTTAEVS
jgi:hypothetical protein